MWKLGGKEEEEGGGRSEDGGGRLEGGAKLLEEGAKRKGGMREEGAGTLVVDIAT